MDRPRPPARSAPPLPVEHVLAAVRLAPYRFLYELAPGWDGVRTPARITTLTSLGLALLAGAGLCVLLRRLVGSRRVLAPTLAAVAAGVVFVEGYGMLPHPTLPRPPSGQLAAPGPQLHLPPSSLEVYWSTAGFPAIVNGVGAFEPTTLAGLWRVVAAFPDRRSVAAGVVFAEGERSSSIPSWPAAPPGRVPHAARFAGCLWHARSSTGPSSSTCGPELTSRGRRRATLRAWGRRTEAS